MYRGKEEERGMLEENARGCVRGGKVQRECECVS